MTAAAPRTSEMPREWMRRFYGVGRRQVWEYSPDRPSFYRGRFAGFEWPTERDRVAHNESDITRLAPGGTAPRFPSWSAAVAWAQETDQ